MSKLKKLIKHIASCNANCLIQLAKIIAAKNFFMPKPILVLMTRWPAANRCKSRLSIEIGAYRAAEIQKRLTNHTISVAQKLQTAGILDIKLAVEGIGPKKINHWARHKGLRQACTQGNGNLGVKMKKQLIFARKKRIKKAGDARDTLIIGTDIPNLCELDILSALNCLTNNQVVIGPSEDGGYWLIGFSKFIQSQNIYWPFSGIEWGSSSVCYSTIKKAEFAGISYILTNKKNDLDVLKDLAPWQK